MGVSFQELLNDESGQLQQIVESFLNNMRVAVPGIIEAFDPEKQTATVQPTIKESLNSQWQPLPLLLDVPVQFPRAGGYSLTFPVKQGDECLIIFADMCIDAWWQSGGIQTQLEKRRHDLSDAICILGITSVPKAIKNFNPNTVQLRNEEGNTYFEIDTNTINIKATTLNIDITDSININSGTSKITSPVDITGATTITGNTTVNGALNAGSGGGNAVIEGNITVKGTVTATNDITTGGTFTGNEAVINNINFTTHKHNEDNGKPTN